MLPPVPVRAFTPSVIASAVTPATTDKPRRAMRIIVCSCTPQEGYSCTQ
jgi:hypothetical protein